MALVKLTQNGGHPIWINPAHVVAVYPSGQGTYIETTAAGNGMAAKHYVTEQAAAAVFQLNGGQA